MQQEISAHLRETLGGRSPCRRGFTPILSRVPAENNAGCWLAHQAGGSRRMIGDMRSRRWRANAAKRSRGLIDGRLLSHHEQ